jgi:integrase
MKKLPSAKQVENWKTPGRHAVGFGVYLQVTGSSGRSWVFRFQHNRRAHHIGLGPVAEVSLAAARDQALRYRRLLREEGINPLAARAAARAGTLLQAARSVTFKQCGERYIAAHEPAWRSAVHRKQWAASLASYVYPVFGDLPVAAIDTALVTKALEPIWATKPATAMRIRGRIELVLDWAKARGYRDGDNPGRWRGHLDKLLPSRLKVRQVRHYAALPYTELPAFMAELRKRDDLGARALEFAILTGARTNEVLGARWDEICHDVWVVPAARMKAGKEHRVPLAKRALEILAALPRAGEFIFPGRLGDKPLSHPMLLATLHRLGRSDLVTHGFRSTLRTWISECTSYPREVAEAVLAHTIQDQVERAYRRGDLFDKRRRLMAEWARYCAAPAKSGVVVRLRR